VWPGDPAKADPDLVPDMHWNDDPQWAGDGKTIRANCDYRLIVDNLLDLTHEQFVHGSSIGHESLSESDFVVTHDDRTVTGTKWMLGIDAPPFWKRNLHDRFPDYDGPVDRWQIIRFEAPCTVTIDVGVAKAGTGAPDGDRSQGVNGFVLNTMTPETDRSCHYLWAFARDWALGSQAITTRLRDGVSGVFFEDEQMLEAQQRGIEANPGYDFYNLNIDSGGMWARRLIDRMIAAESDGRAADTVPDDTVGDAAVAAGAAARAPRPVPRADADLHSRFEEPATLLQRGL
jgi:vanillate O-demethylase monooxygenase subunit